ncbi:MAG: hypothetical protein JW743_00255 [Deltaproteobacteria bacterium]|nr:hypothetical protein [Deltaproteobacteria bacterium]MBN2846716.1 hypothetical protein [Deltaproteobacteria bacterium]
MYRKITLFIGAVFLILTMTGQGLCQAVNQSVPSSDTALEGQETNGHVVRVLYFHSNVRCYSCKKIESLTREALDEGFESEIAQGIIEVTTLNVEDPGNRHFIEDYQLYTKSVIVSDVSGQKESRWKNLTRVWELLGDEAAFKSYVQEEVKKYLSEQKL